jgi:hypothetical protein
MLRLYIEGRWEPEDFVEVLSGVESLYYKAALNRGFLREPPYFWFERVRPSESFGDGIAVANEWFLARSRTIAPQDRRLSVRRIEYASPGKIDLVGFGEACRAVADVIISLTKFFSEGEVRRQANKRAQIESKMKEVDLEKAHESLRSLKIDNARAILKLRDDFPDMPPEFVTTLIAHDQDRLIPRIAESKLIGAKTLTHSAPKDDEADA